MATAIEHHGPGHTEVSAKERSSLRCAGEWRRKGKELRCLQVCSRPVSDSFLCFLPRNPRPLSTHAPPESPLTSSLAHPLRELVRSMPCQCFPCAPPPLAPVSSRSSRLPIKSLYYTRSTERYVPLRGSDFIKHQRRKSCWYDTTEVRRARSVVASFLSLDITPTPRSRLA